MKISMFERAKLNPAGFPQILEQYQRNLQMKMEETPYFLVSLKGRKPKETLDVLELLTAIMKEFGKLAAEE